MYKKAFGISWMLVGSRFGNHDQHASYEGLMKKWVTGMLANLTCRPCMLGLAIVYLLHCMRYVLYCIILYMSVTCMLSFPSKKKFQLLLHIFNILQHAIVLISLLMFSLGLKLSASYYFIFTLITFELHAHSYIISVINTIYNEAA